jgi:hypothetical protein
MSEDEWVAHVKGYIHVTWPPMPGYAVEKMEVSDLRSLHKFVVSLGKDGGPAPYRTPPGMPPSTPVIVFPGCKTPS